MKKTMLLLGALLSQTLIAGGSVGGSTGAGKWLQNGELLVVPFGDFVDIRARLESGERLALPSNQELQIVQQRVVTQDLRIELVPDTEVTIEDTAPY